MLKIIGGAIAVVCLAVVVFSLWVALFKLDPRNFKD
jgi:hypothetical protein